MDSTPGVLSVVAGVPNGVVEAATDLVAAWRLCEPAHGAVRRHRHWRLSLRLLLLLFELREGPAPRGGLSRASIAQLWLSWSEVAWSWSMDGPAQILCSRAQANEARLAQFLGVAHRVPQPVDTPGRIRTVSGHDWDRNRTGFGQDSDRFGAGFGQDSDHAMEHVKIIGQDIVGVQQDQL